MGGRGSTSSAIISFGRKTGTRMLPKQYKEAVSDQADFILRDLIQGEPKQLIIKKSFKDGFAQITLDTGDGVNHETLKTELNRLEEKVSKGHKESQQQKKDANTWSGYDLYRARTQVYAGIVKDIQKLKKKYI